jgi:Membrane bound O-acyl transferase family
MIVMALRSIEWTFSKRPLRRYDFLKDQDAWVKRPLSITNVLLDAFDLLCNQRGIGWSWSSNPFSRDSSPPPSIASVWAKMLLKFTAADASIYIMHRACPPVNNPGGGSLFDPNLDILPRTALAALCTMCGTVWTYAFVDVQYHLATLIGRIIFQQQSWQWPRLSHRFWLSTSIQEFWGFRWHQFYRHLFIVFGARPGGAFLGKPGALVGAFTASAILHHLGVWGLGNGTALITTGGFFLLMCLGTLAEGAFKKVTGLQVKGWAGWSWTMLWTLVWGMFMLDGWAQRGVFASDASPDWLRPGKMLVDGIISLFSR